MIDTEVGVGAAWEEHQELQGCSSTSTANLAQEMQAQMLLHQFRFLLSFPPKKISYTLDVHSHLPTSDFQGRLLCHHSASASSSWGSTCLTDFLCPTASYFATQRATQIHESCYRSWALQPDLAWLDHLRTPTSKNSLCRQSIYSLCMLSTI